jgi:hypothetical protein
VVRHSERFDNLLPAEEKKANKSAGCLWAFGAKHSLDDTPLSTNGEQLADKLETV